MVILVNLVKIIIILPGFFMVVAFSGAEYQLFHVKSFLGILFLSSSGLKLYHV